LETNGEPIGRCLRWLTLRLTGARKEAKPTGARPVEPRVSRRFGRDAHEHDLAPSARPKQEDKYWPAAGPPNCGSGRQRRTRWEAFQLRQARRAAKGTVVALERAVRPCSSPAICGPARDACCLVLVRRALWLRLASERRKADRPCAATVRRPPTDGRPTPSRACGVFAPLAQSSKLSVQTECQGPRIPTVELHLTFRTNRSDG
jgi:hypothetical protein